MFCHLSHTAQNISQIIDFHKKFVDDNINPEFNLGRIKAVKAIWKAKQGQNVDTIENNPVFAGDEDDDAEAAAIDRTTADAFTIDERTQQATPGTPGTPKKLAPNFDVQKIDAALTHLEPFLATKLLAQQGKDSEYMMKVLLGHINTQVEEAEALRTENEALKAKVKCEQTSCLLTNCRATPHTTRSVSPS